MNKTFFAVCAFVPTIALADTYVTGAVGYRHIDSSLSNNVVDFLGNVRHFKSKPSKGGAAFKLGFGLNRAWDSVLAGLELSFARMNHGKNVKKIIAVGDSRVSRVRENFSGTLSGNLGVKMGKSFSAHALLGVTAARFEFKSTAHNPAMAGYTQGIQRKTVWGVTPGIAFRVAVSPKTQLYLESTYTFYKTFKTDDFAPGVEVFKSKVSPCAGSVMVGVNVSL